jgi:enoyl-CoA hydratase/carnithine racemase
MARPDSVEPDLVLLDDLGDGVKRITLNRAAKRNAMNQAARSGIVNALDECRDGVTKVVILTGNGPAFCSGVDLKESMSRPAGWTPQDTIENRRTIWHGVQEEIRQHPAVIIAAVNGLALGGGVTLINTCDLAIAADDAQLGMPEAGFGAFPGLAGPSTLLRTGKKQAAWMVLTAKRITAQQAEAWGLVNSVVPADELKSAAEALAKDIAKFDKNTLEYSKRALWNIPMHIDDYSAAMQYGFAVNAEIQRKMGVSQLEMPDTVKKD